MSTIFVHSGAVVLIYFTINDGWWLSLVVTLSRLWCPVKFLRWLMVIGWYFSGIFLFYYLLFYIMLMIYLIHHSLLWQFECNLLPNHTHNYRSVLIWEWMLQNEIPYHLLDRLILTYVYSETSIANVDINLQPYTTLLHSVKLYHLKIKYMYNNS
jgi:hypothetical protein